MDGDLYFVCWDKDLIPGADFPPLDYARIEGTAVPAGASAPLETRSGVVTITEIADFFVDYIKNDNLGQIANAHVVFADLSSQGAACSECVQLAKLHSTAVDFAKTGVPAVIPRSLFTSKIPSFIHNDKKTTYESEKVLGHIDRLCNAQRLHRYPRKEQTGPLLHQPDLVVDKSLLYPGFEAFVQEAEYLLVDYNAELWKIMQTHLVKDEMEALSGCVSKQGSHKFSGKGREDALQRLKRAVQTLRSSFRDLFWEEWASDLTALLPLAPPLRYTYLTEAVLQAVGVCVLQKASAWYYVTYMQSTDHHYSYQPLISFPFVIFDVLGQVKKNHTAAKAALPKGAL